MIYSWNKICSQAVFFIFLLLTGCISRALISFSLTRTKLQVFFTRCQAMESQAHFFLLGVPSNKICEDKATTQRIDHFSSQEIVFFIISTTKENTPDHCNLFYLSVVLQLGSLPPAAMKSRAAAGFLFDLILFRPFSRSLCLLTVIYPACYQAVLS